MYIPCTALVMVERKKMWVKVMYVIMKRMKLPRYIIGRAKTTRNILRGLLYREHFFQYSRPTNEVKG